MELEDSYLVDNNSSINGYHSQSNINNNNNNNDDDDSPIRRSRSRSRSYDRNSNSRRSYSRSRSPRNRNSSSTQESSSYDRESRHSSRRNESNRSSNNNRGNKYTDRELGLKYRWEKTVFISNIPYDVKWPELKDLFRSKIGEIHFCEIFEKDGKSLGVGAMEFKLLEDAEKAVELMNQYDMGTRKISVRMDNDGYRTRKAKEMSKDYNNKQSVNIDNNQQQTASLLSALNSTNLLAALGLSNTANSVLTGALHQTSPVSPSNASSTNTTQTLLNLLTTLGSSASANLNTSSNSSQLALLNQIAQQNKLEGSVTNRIFIASLDYKVDEHKIREVFSLAGKIHSVSLFKDRDGKSRGMSVVEYATPVEALNAVLMFDNQVLNHRTMNVRFDNKPPLKDEENSIQQSSAKLPSGLKSIGVGLGLGLTGFQSKSDLNAVNPLATGLDALSVLTGGINSSNTNPVNNLTALAGIAGLTGNTGLSNLFGTLNSNVAKSAPTTTISKIFIKNIPFSWDERKLKEKFRQAGPIEYVEIKHRDGKSRGCGLIKFSTPEQALKAVELFNGSRFEGRTLEVKLDQLSN